MNSEAAAKRLEAGMAAPNVYDAEPIPEAARIEIERLLTSGAQRAGDAGHGASVDGAARVRHPVLARRYEAHMPAGSRRSSAMPR